MHRISNAHTGTFLCISTKALHSAQPTLSPTAAAEEHFDLVIKLL